LAEEENLEKEGKEKKVDSDDQDEEPDLNMIPKLSRMFTKDPRQFLE
jgi:hypothetical protein